MADLTADLGLDLSAAMADINTLEARLNRATSDIDVGPGLSNAAKDADDLTEGLDESAQASGRLEKRTSGARSAIIAAGAALAAAGLAKGIRAAVDAASDLEESSAKAATVFGDQFGQVEQFAAGAATSVGLARDQALEATGTFGNLLTAMGQSQEAAAGMSVEVTQLAADLASFNNIEIEEAITALRSGLVGEVEPMRRLGVAIDAAAVEAKALELGIAGANEELTQGQKIQARFAIIMEQTSVAQGDIARTSESFANQQRFLRAELRDVAAEIGTALLPAAQDLLGVARDDLIPALSRLGEDVLPVLLQTFEAASPAIGVTLDLLVALTPAIRILGETLEVIPDGLLAVAGGAVLVNRNLAGLAAGAGAALRRLSTLGSFLTTPWGLAVAGGVAALVKFSQTQANTRARVEELRQSLDEQTGAITENTEEIAANRLQQEGAFAAARELGLSVRQVTEAALGNAEAQRQVDTALQQVKDRYGEVIRSESDSTEGLNRQVEAIVALEAVFGRLSPELDLAQRNQREIAIATGDVTDEMFGTEEAVLRAERAHIRHRGAVEDTTPELEEMTQAQKDLQSAIQSFFDPLSAYSGLLDAKKEAEKESATALAEATEDSSDSWEDFVGDVEVSLGEYADALQEQIDAQLNWRDNLATIAERAGTDVAIQIANMGEEGVQLAAQMADGTEAELAELVPKLRRQAELGSTSAVEALERGLTGLPLTMEQFGLDAISGFARGLDFGINDARIAATEAANAVTSGFDAVLDFGSPSRVMHDLAIDTWAGFIEGTEESSGPVQEAVTQVVDDIVAGASDILSGIGAVGGRAGAQEALQQARRELEGLQAEARSMPRRIGAQRRTVMEAAEAAREVTPEEQGEILRARQQVTDAVERLAEVRADEASSTLDVQVAEAELAEARRRSAQVHADAVGPTRELRDEQQKLRELQERYAALPDEIARAEARLEDATLRAVEAQQRLRQAGQDLIGQGPESEALFRDLAEAAGLTSQEIQTLIDDYRTLQEVSAEVAAGQRTAGAQAVQAAISSSPQVRAAVEVFHDPGAVTNVADVEAAFAQAGIGFGGQIDPADLDRLIREATQVINVRIEGDVAGPLDEQRLATLVRRSRQMAAG